MNLLLGSSSACHFVDRVCLGRRVNTTTKCMLPLALLRGHRCGCRSSLAGLCRRGSQSQSRRTRSKSQTQSPRERPAAWSRNQRRSRRQHRARRQGLMMLGQRPRQRFRCPCRVIWQRFQGPCSLVCERPPGHCILQGKWPPLLQGFCPYLPVYILIYSYLSVFALLYLYLPLHTGIYEYL